MKSFFKNILHAVKTPGSSLGSKNTAIDPLYYERDIPTLIDGLNQTVFQLNAKGQWIYLNAEWEKLTGFTIVESLHTDYIRYIHPDDRDQCKSFIKDIFQNNPQSHSTRIRFLTKDESLCWVNMRANGFVNPKDNKVHLAGVLSNITDRVREYGLQQANYRTLYTLINNLCGLVYRGRNDRDWTMEFVSEGCLDLTGYKPADMANKTVTFGSLINPNDRELVWTNVQSALSENQPYEMNYRITTRNGEEKWVWERGKGNFSSNGELLSIEGFIVDITDYKRNKIRDIENILYKTKTKLPQKYLFLDRLEAAITRSKTYNNYQFALLIVHLDRFNKLQSRYPADFIEQIILDVCRRLNKTIKLTDSLCVFEDGEFQILLENIESIKTVKKVIHDIFHELLMPAKITDAETYLTVSIGVSISSGDTKNRKSVTHEARTALSRANALGGSRYEIFDEDTNARLNALDRMENEIRYALQNDELLLCYKPVASLKTGTITGLETQLYWIHPRRGKISSEKFSSVKADDEILNQLNQWIATTLTNQIQLWASRAELKLDFYLVIQFCGEKVFAERFIDQIEEIFRIEEILLRDQHNKLKLLIKIPEPVLKILSDNRSTIIETIDKHHIQFVIMMEKLGIPSSEELLALPIHSIQLNHKVVIEKPETEKTEVGKTGDSAYLKAQIDFIHALGMCVSLNGIDTQKQFEEMQALGVDYMQGDFISRPLDSHDLVQFITDKNDHLQSQTKTVSKH